MCIKGRNMTQKGNVRVCGAGWPPPEAYLEHIGRHVVVQEEGSVHQEVWEVVHSVSNAKNLQQNI